MATRSEAMRGNTNASKKEFKASAEDYNKATLEWGKMMNNPAYTDQQRVEAMNRAVAAENRAKLLAAKMTNNHR